MIKKVNKNKFGVIEYSITDEEDLKDLPKGDTDNSVYAVDDSNKVYLYSKKANDYILINGGGTDSSNGFFVKRIDMGNPNTEVDSKLSNIDLKLNPNKVYKTYAGFLNFINNPKSNQLFISMDNAINKYTNDITLKDFELGKNKSNTTTKK